MIDFNTLTFAGSHISEACEKAVAMATEANDSCKFDFNGTEVIVQPGENPGDVMARWEIDYEAAGKAYREHPDRAIEAAAREQKAKEDRERVMVDTSADEAAMREASVPWPNTEKQLLEYVGSLLTRQHDYGTCMYAMSMSAVAAFQYIAGQLGVTGFQASCADLDIIRRTRSIKGPFILIQGADALYPQYDLPGKLQKAMEEWRPWLKEEAQKKLDEQDEDGGAHPNVVAHWQSLVSPTPEPEEEPQFAGMTLKEAYGWLAVPEDTHESDVIVSYQRLRAIYSPDHMGEEFYGPMLKINQAISLILDANEKKIMADNQAAEVFDATE